MVVFKIISENVFINYVLALSTKIRFDKMVVRIENGFYAKWSDIMSKK